MNARVCDDRIIAGAATLTLPPYSCWRPRWRLGGGASSPPSTLINLLHKISTYMVMIRYQAIFVVRFWAYMCRAMDTDSQHFPQSLENRRVGRFGASGCLQDTILRFVVRWAMRGARIECRNTSKLHLKPGTKSAA